MNKSIILIFNLSIGLAFFFLNAYHGAITETEINITGIKNPKGQVVIQVFDSENGFQEETPFKTFKFDKKVLSNGTMQVKISLEPSVYGFTMVDDENLNGKIDKTFIGIPKEGFGFSNFFMEKLQKPKFTEFSINLSTTHKITMKVKYM